MDMFSGLKARGDVQAIIEHLSGRVDVIEFPNTVLGDGRKALAASLANKFIGNYPYYISRMVFGDGGTSNGSPKFISTDRMALYCGTPVVSKPVVATVDPNVASQVILTSILTVNDGNGYSLNEMALQMSNDQLYSMVTFPDLNKTNQMQITWSWRCSFV